jgi:N-acetylmuramoyl-L-alanine amidase
MELLEKIKSIASIVAMIAIPVVIAYLGNIFNRSVKEREVQGKFVELAINILNQQPTSENTNIRQWATEVINKYSGVPLTKETQEDLINKLPLSLQEIYPDVQLPQKSGGVLRIEKNLLQGEGLKYALSPNTSKDFRMQQVKGIVIHSTATLSAKAVTTWLQQSDAKASAHLVIDRDGTVTQLVPFNYMAWHVGNSTFKGLNNLNKFTIGIELVNGLQLRKEDNRYVTLVGSQQVPDSEVAEAKHPGLAESSYWHKYTNKQFEALKNICKLLHAQYKVSFIAGDHEVRPNRKLDPGPLMPLDQLRSDVLGVPSL